jgi:hypothetical protein
MSCFSLRGKFNMDDNSRLNPVRLFDYVSPDRTRAWRVARAYIWPLTVRASTGSDADGKYTAQFALSTDDGLFINWTTITDPTENRAFAWASWNGYCRDSGSDDFIIAEVEPFAHFLVDPDVLVVKELWVSGASTKEGTTNPNREWGYMVVLEETKISPSQSVFQQIKGMGQDVS